MDRRMFLTALAAGVAVGLTACDRSTSAPTSTLAPQPASGQPARPVAATHRVPPGGQLLERVVPDGVIDRLPGSGQNLALTVDDGTDSAVVGAYLDFVKDSGIRLTFFPNGSRPSWTEHAATLRPLIESGQVQMGNHTWSHPDLRGLSDAAVADQITRNERFLNTTLGVSGRPFLRPPYGYYNTRVSGIAADHGYWVLVMWYGSLGDAYVLSPQQIMTNARQWVDAQRIVIGHANHPAVTETYADLVDLIRERQLQTVTLNDVFNTR